ncbi:MAG: acetyl-CoA carboxylase biotin carboxylase subunit [Pelagibacterales bacterium]|nr:acetyl-CoA carboxylase biotin carboxylase subunit [Pelagibacterales bacterium]|tara:strand:- start:5311 stop:6654 length:1344 start_codon:yes stop_codon:yes gene_type:complete
MFKKVLIANRGEIAVRIIRSCQELGINTVAIHSKADEDAMHVKMANESICIGNNSAKESYLNIPAIITATELTGADAIHPGYGFLSENYRFANILEEHDIAFIGPKPKHIEVMGDKIKARETISKTGIPLVPGSDGSIINLNNLKKTALKIGYPIIIKAASGGGGKGMKVVYTEDNLKEQFELAKVEAKANFGNDEVYIEKFLENPKHIEFQVFADKHGNVIHLGERDCSMQRRHQKIIEEAPAHNINILEKKKVLKSIISAMKKIGYVGAGTVEMLYENGKFYFIEMNTRLQVEHPVTEMVTGFDIVSEQIKVASGQKLKIKQEDISFLGHSIECRINAENSKTFLPSPGVISAYHTPGGPGVRIDSAAFEKYKVLPYYDSLIGKLIVHADNRDLAIARMKRALNEFIIEGIDTTLELHKAVISTKEFKSSNYDIKWLEKYLARKQ